MILSLGLSSAIGAPLVALGMSYFGPQSLYYFISLILLVFVLAAEIARRVDDHNKSKERIAPLVLLRAPFVLFQ